MNEKQNNEHVTPENPEIVAPTTPVEPVGETPVESTPVSPTAPVTPASETPVESTPIMPTTPTPPAPQDAGPPEQPVFTPSPTTTTPQPPSIPTLGGPVPPTAQQGTWPTPTGPQPPVGGQVPSYGGVTPAPKRSSLPIIIGVAAVLVIGVVVFMLTRDGGKTKLKANPEDTLFEAMAATEENMAQYPPIFPETTFDYEKPYETTLDLSLDASRNEYLGMPDYLSNMRLKLDLKQDSKKRELLFGAQFESPIFTLDYSEFYVNPQEALFSIPNLYSAKDYVQVDFATFPESWNNSNLSDGAKIPEDMDISSSITQFMDGLDETVANVKEMDELDSFKDLMDAANEKLKAATTITHLETTDETFDFKVVIPPGDMTLYLQALAEQMTELTFRQNRVIAQAIPASLYEMMGSSQDEFIDSSMGLGETYESLQTIFFMEDVVLIVKVDREVSRISHVELVSTSFAETDYPDDKVYAAGTLSLSNGAYAIDDFNFSLLLSQEPEGWKTDAEFVEIKVLNKAPEGDLVGAYTEITVTVDDRTGDIQGGKFVLDLSWNKDKAATEPMVLRFSGEDLYYEESYSAIITTLVGSDKDKISFSDGRITIQKDAQDLLSFDFDFSVQPFTGVMKPVPTTTADFFDVDWMTQAQRFVAAFYSNAMTMM